MGFQMTDKTVMTESKTNRFNVDEELVKLGVDLSAAVSRLQDFLNKEFYGRASDYSPKEAAEVLSDCENLLAQIKSKLKMPEPLKYSEFNQVFEEILGGIRIGKIRLDRDMYNNAQRIYDNMKETSQGFNQFLDKITDTYADDFYGEDSEDAVAALILALKRLKIIK